MDGDVDEVVSKYLEEGLGLHGEQVWPDVSKSLGDEVVRVHAIRVLNRKGEVCTNFDVRDPVSVEIEYKVLEECHKLVVQCCFINEMGHLLFYTKDNLDSPWRDVPYPVGHFKTVCHIPGDFFNEGCIFVTYGIDEPERFYSTNRATGLDVLGFVVSDRMDPGGVRGNFKGRWSKYGLRPRMKWDVKMVSSRVAF